MYLKYILFLFWFALNKMGSCSEPQDLPQAYCASQAGLKLMHSSCPSIQLLKLPVRATKPGSYSTFGIYVILRLDIPVNIISNSLTFYLPVPVISS